MAIYYNTYEIELKINDQVIDTDPQSYSFTMKDSIYQLYPELTLDINDEVGILQEFGLFFENIPIQTTFGYENNFIQNNYVIIDDALENKFSPNKLSGIVSVNARHTYYNDQEITSKAYSGNISDITNEVIAPNQWNSINIDNITASSTYYQPLITNEQFLLDILRPNAFSTSSGKSPHYIFIDSANNFNFKSYKTLFNNGSVTTLEFIQQDTETLSINDILDLKRFKVGSDIYEDYKKRLVFQHNIEDLELVENEDLITSYPTETNKQLSIVQTEKIKSYIDLGYTKTSLGDKQALEARQINSTYDSMAIEKMLVTLHLNINLLAGKIISINIPTADTNTNQENSANYTGEYLIEESVHTWDANNQKAYTQLIISRKFINLNTDYLIKNKLFSV
jgi:hypothetical protein